MEQIDLEYEKKRYYDCKYMLNKLFDLYEKAPTAHRRKDVLRKIYMTAHCAEPRNNTKFEEDNYYINFRMPIKDLEVKCKDFAINRVPKCKKSEYMPNSSNEEILDHLVGSIWCEYIKSTDLMSYVVGELGKSTGSRTYKLTEESFIDECTDASKKLKDRCDYLGIECKRLVIHGGFRQDDDLYDGCKFHYFNIINLKGKNYIVDTTYRQFILMPYSLLERLYVLDFSGCTPGAFIQTDIKRLRLARNLIERGWVEATDDVLKVYFDLFALSFRNGTYYLKTNDYSFTTPYTVEDYFNFLKGNGSQYDIEGDEVMGYQREPINKLLNFRIKH